MQKNSIKQNIGPLIIVGGAEDKKSERTILRGFLQLAGGKDAKILVLTVASEWPKEVGDQYVSIFSQMIGLHDGWVKCLEIESRHDANDDKNLSLLEEATAVFFTGGNQLRAVNLIGGTHLDTILHECHSDGLVLGGTSAGAAVMASTMIVGGISDCSPCVDAVRLGPGLEFLPGVIIDQHFAQRGRITRLLSAVAQYPHLLGIGIDEDTALIAREHSFEVIGRGAVTVLDAGEMKESSRTYKSQEPLALCGIKLHILPGGYGYDMLQREPLAAPELPEPLPKNVASITNTMEGK